MATFYGGGSRIGRIKGGKDGWLRRAPLASGVARALGMYGTANYLPNKKFTLQTTCGAQPQEVLHRYFVDSRPTTKDCLLTIGHG